MDEVHLRLEGGKPTSGLLYLPCSSYNMVPRDLVESFKAPNDVASEILEHYFYHILLVKQVPKGKSRFRGNSHIFYFSTVILSHIE